jgi:hypothetical protein
VIVETKQGMRYNHPNAEVVETKDDGDLWLTDKDAGFVALYPKGSWERCYDPEEVQS